MTWGEKLEKIILLERKLQDESIELKITQYGLVFVEKSMSEMKRENLITKIKNFTKIKKKLIYASKLKSNVIEKYIRKKKM